MEKKQYLLACVLCGEKGMPFFKYLCLLLSEMFSIFTYSISACSVTQSTEGNGTPLQYSCLENPMDGGAWWAAVHRVAKSWILFTFMHWRRKWQPSPVFLPGESQGAWPRDQSRDLSPNASGGLTPLSPPSELQEIPVAIREQSGVLCFHSR